jgi:hypothetical protein
MHIVATITVAVALVFLLLLGFLRVARELFARSVYAVPPPDGGVDVLQIERDSGRREPEIVEFDSDPIESLILNIQSASGRPGEHHAK